MFKVDLHTAKNDQLRKKEFLATLAVSRSKPPNDNRLRMPQIKGALRDRPKLRSIEPTKDLGLDVYEGRKHQNRVRLTPVGHASP